MPFQFYCPQGHLLEGHESQMGQQSQCPMCGSVFVMPMMPGAPMQPGGPMPGGAMHPGAWPGYGQPGMPGYGQPAAGGYAPPGAPGYGQPAPPGYGQPMPQGYPPMHPVGYPGYPAGYPGSPENMMPGGAMPGYGQPAAEPTYSGPPGEQAPSGFPAINTQGLPATDLGAAPAVQGGSQPQAASEPAATPESPAAAAPSSPPAEEKKEPRIVRIPCPQGHELQTPMDMVNQEVLCPICATQFHLRYEDSLEFKEEQVELRRRKAEQLNSAALKWSIITAAVVVAAIVGMIIYHVASAPPSEPNYGTRAESTEADSEQPATEKPPSD
jgi:hypothetical protein